MKNLIIGQWLVGGFVLVLVLVVCVIVLVFWWFMFMVVVICQMMDEFLVKECLIVDWNCNINVGVCCMIVIVKSFDILLVVLFVDDQVQLIKQVGELMECIWGLICLFEEQVLFDVVGKVCKIYIGVCEDVVKLKKDGQVEEVDKVLIDVFILVFKVYFVNM